FGNNERGFIQLIYSRPTADFPAAQAIVVIGNIHNSTRGKIWINLKLFALQMLDGSINQFNKIMRKNFRGKPNRNPFPALIQKQRKFYGKINWFFSTPVIRSLPSGNLWIVNHIQSKF